MSDQGSGRFIALVDDKPWEPAEPLGLPDGVEWRPYELHEDQQVILVRFPPGYVEPRHVHASEHLDVIVEGEMHVDGLILRRGDYIHGFADKPHGPMSYPVGCTVFAVLRGPSMHHDLLPDADD